MPFAAHTAAQFCPTFSARKQTFGFVVVVVVTDSVVVGRIVVVGGGIVVVGGPLHRSSGMRSVMSSFSKRSSFGGFASSPLTLWHSPLSPGVSMPPTSTSAFIRKPVGMCSSS